MVFGHPRGDSLDIHHRPPGRLVGLAAMLTIIADRLWLWVLKPSSAEADMTSKWGTVRCAKNQFHGFARIAKNAWPFAGFEALLDRRLEVAPETNFDLKTRTPGFLWESRAFWNECGIRFVAGLPGWRVLPVRRGGGRRRRPIRGHGGGGWGYRAGGGRIRPRPRHRG